MANEAEPVAEILHASEEEGVSATKTNGVEEEHNAVPVKQADTVTVEANGNTKHSTEDEKDTKNGHDNDLETKNGHDVEQKQENENDETSEDKLNEEVSNKHAASPTNDAADADQPHIKKPRRESDPKQLQEEESTENGVEEANGAAGGQQEEVNSNA